MLEQILVAIIAGGLASGLGAFIGVKVSLGKVETRLNGHDRDLEDVDDRLKWLERKR